jgi:hypothetical protein
MSRFVIHGCCAMTLLLVCACGPGSAPVPRHPDAEARNGETEKKTRKPRPPVVAPPPAYGNKIVRDDEWREDLAQHRASGLESARF